MREVVVNEGYKRLGAIFGCAGFVAACVGGLYLWGDIKSGNPRIKFEDFGPYLLGACIAVAGLHYTTFWGWGWIAAQKGDSGVLAAGSRIARGSFVVFLIVQVVLVGIFLFSRLPSFSWFHILFFATLWPTLGWIGMYSVILISWLCQWVADGFAEGRV